MMDSLPLPPKSNPAVRRVVAGILVRESDGHILVCQRSEKQALALKWEFPGGKIEPGEGPEAALRRELQEELGIEAEIGPLLTQFVHTYRNRNQVELAFYRVLGYSGEMKNQIFHDIRWARREDLPKYDFLEADVKLVREIAEGKIV